LFLHEGKVVWEGMTHEFTTSTNPIVQQVRHYTSSVLKLAKIIRYLSNCGTCHSSDLLLLVTCSLHLVAWMDPYNTSRIIHSRDSNLASS
jgi:hypothetical protein